MLHPATIGGRIEAILIGVIIRSAKIASMTTGAIATGKHDANYRTGTSVKIIQNVEILKIRSIRVTSNVGKAR
jgi:hypothetical protein